jgi:MoxR-like ATPase
MNIFHPSFFVFNSKHFMARHFNSTNAIKIGEIWLPQFLFYQNQSRSKSISPAAALNPETAVDGHGFETSTSPSSEPLKKTLVIDVNSLEFVCFDYAEKIALLKRLKVFGFEVFLCLPNQSTEGANSFEKLADNFENIEKLKDLSQFSENQNDDYQELAKAAVESDKVLFLAKDEFGRDHVGAIKKSIEQETYWGPLSGNAIRCDFRKISDERFKRFLHELPTTHSYYSDTIHDPNLLLIFTLANQQQRIEIREALVKKKNSIFEKFGKKVERDDALNVFSSIPQIAPIRMFADHEILFEKQNYVLDAGFFANFLNSYPEIEDFLINKYLDRLKPQSVHGVTGFGKIFLFSRQLNSLIAILPHRKREIFDEALECCGVDGAEFDLDSAHNKFLEEQKRYLTFNEEKIQKYLKPYVESYPLYRYTLLADLFGEPMQEPDLNSIIRASLSEYSINESLEYICSSTAYSEKTLAHLENLGFLEYNEDLKTINSRNLELFLRSTPERAERIFKDLDVASFAKAQKFLPLRARLQLSECLESLNCKNDFSFDSRTEFQEILWSQGSIERLKPTYLNIAGPCELYSTEGIDAEALKAGFTQGLFEDVVVIRFGTQNASELQSVINLINWIINEPSSRQFISLKHIVLSDQLQIAESAELSNLLKILAQIEVGVSFENYEEYLGVKEYADYLSAASHERRPKKKNQIRLGNCQTESKLGTAKSEVTPTFSMQLAGEVLNDAKISPQIRVSLIERNIVHSLEQKEYLPEALLPQPLKKITAQDVKKLRSKPKIFIYCQFNLELTQGQLVRLSSFHANEELIGILGDTQGLEIFRGDDDFFYATTTKASHQLSYVVKGQNPITDLKLYKELQANDPIKLIIDEYRGDGFEWTATAEKEDVGYDEADHATSMEKMYAQKLGVCRHRLAAVEYKLRTTLGIDQKRFRVVGINGNHVILEVKNENDLWIKVDLGGGSGELINEETPYKPKALGPDFQITQAPEQTLQELATQAEDADASQLAIIAKALLAKTNLEQVEIEAELVSKTINSQFSKILIVTAADKIQSHANFLLSTPCQAELEVGAGPELGQESKAAPTKKQRRGFYIDGWHKVNFCQQHLFIDGDETPILDQTSELAKFLKESQQSSKGASRPLLVISWAAFNSKQKVSLNTILDQSRSINGEEIGEMVQIISLVDKTPKDASFLSRHDLSFESKVDLAPALQGQNLSQKIIIDLQGFSNWRRSLFGKVVLVGDKMLWQKSDFTRALESHSGAAANFEIINISAQDAKEFKKEFAQAKALGYFTYHGFDIALPAQTNIGFGFGSFDFKKFDDGSKIRVANNITLGQAPADAALINSHLFDLLLCDKKIADGQYQETAGLIEVASAQEARLLKLFISSPLSEGQWYCLFNQAQQLHVALELYLAPSVKIPTNVVFEDIVEVAEAAKQSLQARIIATNDCEQEIEALIGEFGVEESKGESRLDQKRFSVIDVEDCTYQDLIEKIDFETTPQGFRNFRKTESGFLQRLKSGEKIVLRGQFSEDLLQMLQPVLTSDFAQNLTLVIEDKNCHKTANSALKWLAKEDYSIAKFAEYAARKAAVFIEDETAFEDDLSNSKDLSEAFIQGRKALLMTTLKDRQMLCLVGESGVGKSSLMREFEKDFATNPEESEVQIYREMSRFQAWTSNKSKRTKILFIDESNIEDTHFTIFSPLKKGDKRVFYQGKFYDLDQHHKVVFAHNEREYGGGRVEQKLFSDGAIPQIKLQDFPNCYIYEKILRQSIFEALSPKPIAEEDFQALCQGLIEDYRQNGNETVRELQNKVLMHLSQLQEMQQQTIASENFVSTSATQEVERELREALKVKRAQRNGQFPQKSVGLNGIFLEGDSGTGKSALIEAMLASMEILEAKIGESLQTNRQYFYKIDASLALAQKTEILIKAFEEGNIVWIDEINSCIDDGLEKILNSLLTGDHPNQDRATAPKLGFMLISSLNSVALEGRSSISPALRHRSVKVEVKSLKEYKERDLETIVLHWLGQEETSADDENYDENEALVKIAAQEIKQKTAQLIATDFCKLLQIHGAKDLNLRMLKSALGAILPTYIERAKISATEITLLDPTDSTKASSAQSLLQKNQKIKS